MSAGLYRPDDVRDNCGFGLIAHMEGEASHRLLETAIESLTCMTHRGGIAADGKTGDGCGLLLKKPEGFLRAEAKQLFGSDLSANFGIGQIFLSTDEKTAEQERQGLNKALSDEGLTVLGWREVPTQPDVCGEIALASLPRIEQVFISCELDTEVELNRRLFVARRMAEKAMAQDESFYKKKKDTK